MCSDKAGSGRLKTCSQACGDFQESLIALLRTGLQLTSQGLGKIHEAVWFRRDISLDYCSISVPFWVFASPLVGSKVIRKQRSVWQVWCSYFEAQPGGRARLGVGCMPDTDMAAVEG